MPQSDAVLFDKWRASSDADAFAELLSRHASMVYGACLRVVRNPGIAEEVAQECFLELMKGPRGIQCIGAWLHTVATRRALDRVKAEARRSEREKNYATARDTTMEATWDDTREFVDEAIASLPDDLRVPIVLRFLEGRTHEAIAEELSISRSSARARIKKGIGTIRENLAKQGVQVTAATLATGLESAAADPVPHALIADLGKRALGVKSGTSVVNGTSLIQYAAATVLVAGGVASGFWMSAGNGDTPEPAAAAVAATTPTEAAPEPSPSETLPSASPTLPNEPNAAVETDATALPQSKKTNSTDGWRLDLAPSEALKEALQQTVNVSFKNIHIKQVAEFLSDSYGLNLQMDFRVVAPEVKEIAPAETTSQDPTPGQASGDQSLRLPRRYITDGQVRTAVHKGITVQELLTIVTSSLNLTYKIRGNTVWISSSSQLTEDMTVPLPSAPFSEGDMLTKLSSPVSMEFEEIHISGVLQYLRETYDVNIALDTQVVMPQTKTDDGEALDLAHFASDGMIDYMLVQDLSLAEALFVATRLTNLTYRVGKDGIYISTPDRLTGSF